MLLERFSLGADLCMFLISCKGEGKKMHILKEEKQWNKPQAPSTQGMATSERTCGLSAPKNALALRHFCCFSSAFHCIWRNSILCHLCKQDCIKNPRVYFCLLVEKIYNSPNVVKLWRQNGTFHSDQFDLPAKWREEAAWYLRQRQIVCMFKLLILHKGVSARGMYNSCSRDEGSCNTRRNNYHQHGWELLFKNFWNYHYCSVQKNRK